MSTSVVVASTLEKKKFRLASLLQIHHEWSIDLNPFGFSSVTNVYLYEWFLSHLLVANTVFK